MTACALFSSGISQAVLRGLSLAALCAVPSLFPSSVIAGTLIRSGAADRLIRSAGRPFSRLTGLSPACFQAYVFGLLGGYPTGVSVLCDLFDRGILAPLDAALGSALCLNCGLPFLAAVCSARSTSFAAVTAAHLIGGAAAYGVCRTLCKRKRFTAGSAVKRPDITSKTCGKQDILQKTTKSFTASVFASAGAMLKVCGFVALFTPPAEAAARIAGDAPLAPVLAGMLEMTGGAFRMPPGDPVGLAFCVSFGGLCVLMQGMDLLFERGLPVWPMAAAKILHGIFSALAAYGLSFAGVL